MPAACILAAWFSLAVVCPAPATAQSSADKARRHTTQKRDRPRTRPQAARAVRPGARATKKHRLRANSVARRLRRGIARYEHERYAQAIVDLRAALALEPSPVAHFYLARCYDAQEETVLAVDEYLAFLADVPTSMKPQADIAERRLESLRAVPDTVAISSTPAVAMPPLPSMETSAARAPPATAALPDPGELESRPTLLATRAKQPPQIDGVLDDEEWQAVPPAVTFTQKAPLAGRAPTDKTLLRLLYDDDAVYVGFECEQVNSPVVALLARRDRPTDTDSVSVAFDSRSEGRSAFEFSVNAAGVLIDGMRFDDGKISREWDEIWEAKTEVREHGWSAEFRIPLQALRFESAANQTWGFQARRYISARQETDEWAFVPLDAGGEVSHYGAIEGLRDLGSASLEFQPFVLGRARHQASDPAIVRSGWDLSPSAGLDLKWRPANNFVLNGTINPDFGQVEADRLILNLSTVELVFPEKRPFFLAGMDDFVTMTPIFYSRRIGRTPRAPRLSRDPLRPERLYEYPEPTPIYGALKLAADLNDGWNVAALMALTGPNQVEAVLPDGATRRG